MLITILGLIVGFCFGYAVGSSETTGNTSSNKVAGNTCSNEDHKKFGPCPRCRNMANLNEWKCGACNYTLHEM